MSSLSKSKNWKFMVNFPNSAVRFTFSGICLEDFLRTTCVCTGSSETVCRCNQSWVLCGPAECWTCCTCSRYRHSKTHRRRQARSCTARTLRPCPLLSKSSTRSGSSQEICNALKTSTALFVSSGLAADQRLYQNQIWNWCEARTRFLSEIRIKKILKWWSFLIGF